jgi:hypothetical protein
MCISKIILVVILIIFAYNLFIVYENYRVLLKDNNLEKYFPLFNTGNLESLPTPSSCNLEACAILVGTFANAIKNNLYCLLPKSAKFVYWSRDSNPIGMIYKNCLIFRGTQTPADILIDLKTSQTNGIHSGYKKIFDSLRFDCNDKIDTVIGHSMGGALAQLYGYLTNTDAEVVTFASPRVYSPERLEHALFVNPKVYNVVNMADSVCVYPATYVVNDIQLYTYMAAPPVKIYNVPRDNLQDCHSMVSYYELVKFF